MHHQSRIFTLTRQDPRGRIWAERKAPDGTGARGDSLLRRGRQTTTPRNTRTDSAVFDQPMFERKLEELVKQNVKNFEAGRLKVFDANRAFSFDIQEAYLMKLVDTDIGVLRESFVPAVDRACREVQRSSGNEITSGFIREELLPRVLAAIDGRREEVRQNVETLCRLVVRDSNRCLPTALAHLSREAADLKEGLKTHYDIEIVQIKRQQSGPKLSVAKKAIKLTAREENLWNVIQRMSKGRQYCREVDGAGIPIRKTGVWKGAPRTYLAAYDAGKPWCHRIEDEKFKVKRKAKLAKLATKLEGE